MQSVWSHLDTFGGTKASNYAISGDKMGDILALQVPLIDSTVDLVLIECGANDICGYASASLVTSNSTFRSQTQQIINGILAAAKPGVKIVIFSIPNIYNLWNVFHTQSAATTVWNYAKICQPMLLNPTSTDPADVARRSQMAAQIVTYNSILQEVCSATPNGQCIFDNGLVYNWAFVVDDISTLDYFHPSCTSISNGQGYVASLAWNFLSNTVGFAANTAQPSVSKAPAQASGSSSGSNSCFAGSETVLLESGEYKTLHDVSEGDRIMIVSMDGSVKGYSEVLVKPHGHNSIATVFVHMTTDSGRDIKMTADHLLLAGQCGAALTLVQAALVRPGHCLQSVLGQEKITSVISVHGAGVYTVVTKDAGLLVVNGIVASPFAVSHAVPEAFYDILRILHTFVPVNSDVKYVLNAFGDLLVSLF